MTAWTADEMMTIAAARRLPNGAVCFVGIGLPSAACNLARLTHAPDLVLIYESGTVGTRPSVLPLSIGDGELAETARSVIPLPEAPSVTDSSLVLRSDDGAWLLVRSYPSSGDQPSGLWRVDLRRTLRRSLHGAGREPVEAHAAGREFYISDAHAVAAQFVTRSEAKRIVRQDGRHRRFAATGPHASIHLYTQNLNR